jgi:hypothetical protein
MDRVLLEELRCSITNSMTGIISIERVIACFADTRLKPAGEDMSFVYFLLRIVSSFCYEST